MKYGKLIINSAKQFCDLTNKFIPSISTLFQKRKYLPCKPDDIEQSLSIPPTLKLHKLVRLNISDGVARLDFYFLSNGKELYLT